MFTNDRERARVGLCVSCRYSRLVRTDRGSVFYQCERSATDPRYAKYPRLPILVCPGYESDPSKNLADAAE